MCPHKEIMHAWLGRVVSTPDSPVQVTPNPLPPLPILVPK